MENMALILKDEKVSRRLNEKIKNIIRIYFAYFKIKFLNEIQYKIPAIAGILTQFAWGIMNIMLYQTFMQEGTSDYTVSQMATYIWLNQAFFALFNLWAVDNEILEECRTGKIAMELIKPIDLYFIWYSKTLGVKLARVILRAIPILIVASLPFMGTFRLYAPVNITALLFTIITLINSLGIMLAYLMIMYIAVMKTIGSQGLRTAFYLVLNFCSGSLVPIPFMPDAIVKILKLTPFYYMQNVSFNIYNGYITDMKEIVKIIILQLIWFVILSILGKKMMNKQIKRVEVSGG